MAPAALSRAAAQAVYGVREPVPDAASAAPVTLGLLHGNIAEATHDGVAGWVLDDAHPTIPVTLEVVTDGQVIARGVADRMRADLAMAGIGDGRAGFAIALPGLTKSRDYILQIRCAAGGAEIPGSPLLVAGARGSADGLRAALGERDPLKLAENIDRLVQARLTRP